MVRELVAHKSKDQRCIGRSEPVRDRSRRGKLPTPLCAHLKTFGAIEPVAALGVSRPDLRVLSSACRRK
jgi:hypothetical protein